MSMGRPMHGTISRPMHVNRKARSPQKVSNFRENGSMILGILPSTPPPPPCSYDLTTVEHDIHEITGKFPIRETCLSLINSKWPSIFNIVVDIQ